MKTSLCLAMAVLTAAGALAADPAITDVSVRQRWPWSRLVDIQYVLACDQGTRWDVEVTAYDGDTPLTLPQDSLAGDLSDVANGARRIVWDPSKSSYTNAILPRFRVALAPVAPPLYLIVDLTKAPGAAGQVEKIFPGDARLETTGRWTNVWFGVTNDAVYATDKLVLRRVNGGSFMMGDESTAPVAVTLTKSYYVGVFEVTQAQWKNVRGGYPGSRFTVQRDRRPTDYVSFIAIRGDGVGTNWPAGGHAVDDNRFIGSLRIKTGLAGFDLPTEAQWECACRAGTMTYYNDGLGTPSNTVSNDQMNALGRYSQNVSVTSPNSSTAPEDGGTALVGSYQPNNWGVYDMLGNVEEWCLDRWLALQGGTDPVGSVNPATVNRAARGGCYRFNGASNRCATRNSRGEATAMDARAGCRVVLNLE